MLGILRELLDIQLLEYPTRNGEYPGGWMSREAHDIKPAQPPTPPTTPGGKTKGKKKATTAGFEPAPSKGYDI
jgi:hypothetical protein